MAKRLVTLVALVFLVAAGVWASGTHEQKKKGPIVVGSKIDTEGGLLGSMIVEMLRANDFQVVDKTEFGTTSVVRKAIKNGEIDIYPEYTGDGAYFFPHTKASVWKNAKKGYELVKKLDYERNKIVWLTPAPADNTWAIAVPSAFSKKHNIVDLSQFGKYIRDGGQVKLAASEEFASRPGGLAAMEKAYNFNLKKSQLLLFSGGNTAQTEKAAADGTDGVNAAMAYGDDGQLSALGLVVLNDNKHIEPVYEPTPIVREAIYKKYPQIEQILAPVFKSLTRKVLQRLNAEIAIQGREAKVVAKQYLTSNGFLKK